MRTAYLPTRLSRVFARIKDWALIARALPASKRWSAFLASYFGLLLAAVVGKYLTTQWGDLLQITVGRVGLLGWLETALRWSWRVLLVYRVDVVENALLAALLSGIGLFFRRRGAIAIACMTLAIAVLLTFAAVVAVEQTGVPLTSSTAAIAVQWARQNPGIIPTVVPFWQIALLFVGAAAYGSVPGIFALALSRGGRVQSLAKQATLAMTCVVVGLLTFALAMPGRILPTLTATLSPTEAHWTSMVVAFANVERNNALANGVTDSDIMQSYSGVAYPLGRETGQHLIGGAEPAQRPLHVVVVVLETAPNAYYRIASNPALPTFHAMTAHSIVSEQHFTTRPYTLLAIYSVLTGTYPRSGVPIGQFGAFRNDGLATQLAERGYETTYIDSYRADWGYGFRAELIQHGFNRIEDSTFTGSDSDDAFQSALTREHWSFRRAIQRIAGTQASGKKSLAIVATTLGHFPWRAPEHMKARSAAEKMAGIATALDDQMKVFLHSLDSLGLRDSTIIVVTGDHGLRFKAEYDSFGSEWPPDNADFHVPFLLYAPSLVHRRIDVSHATSHIDIAPTVFHLLGIPTERLLLHGESMLNDRLVGRALYLMNTGLSPEDAVLFGGRRYRFNRVSHVLQVGGNTRFWGTDSLHIDQIPRLLDAANTIFNSTASVFLERAQQHPTTSSAIK